jgi:chaperonin GroEL
MQFDRSYIPPYFLTNPELMEAAPDEPLVLIHEKKINNVKDILALQQWS